MDENKNKVQSNNLVEDSGPKEEQVQAIKTTEFMKETIKKRPINKMKLAKRLILTVAMAVVFGLVACLTFLLLQPVISNRLNPPEQEIPELENITFVEETVEEETLPQDMIVDESELNSTNIEPQPLDENQIEQVLKEIELGIDEYVALSGVVTNTIKEASKSVVDVVGITKDKDWFDNSYSNENVVAGVIIADNGRDLLILCDLSEFSDTDELKVRFYDDSMCQSSLYMKDKSTGIAIVGVTKARMRRVTIDNVKIIDMATTSNRELNGTSVIALGRPIGIEKSVGVGIITSYSSLLSKIDSNYMLLTTDISGTSSGSGVLINPHGQLMGLIFMSARPDGLNNVVSAIGISDLKRLAEKMSNGKEPTYLGMHGSDVTEEISNDMSIPVGVYITKLEMDSPLLEAGIQSGDIITKFTGVTVSNFKELNNLRLALDPESTVSIEVMRQGPDGFTALEYEVRIPNAESSENAG